MLTLVVTARDDSGREPRTVDVRKPKVVLGRAPDCDVVLEPREMGASSQHARIELVGHVYHLFDQGSTNGTWFNGTRLRKETGVPIANNDKIYIGRWLITCKLAAAPTRRWKAGATVDPVAKGAVGELKAAEATDGNEELRQKLKAKLEATPPNERGALLAQLEATLPEGPARAAVVAETERRESVRDAAFQALCSLSRAHSGHEAPFETPEEVERFFRLSDQALERMLEWIVGCISARRSFEDKFSAKVTQFFGLGANPLKHALTPQQAGRYLLDWSEPREAEKIKTSLEQTLRDLTAHQLGVLAGAQHVVKALLKRLDPAGFQKEAGGAWSVKGARAKAWAAFEAAYKDLIENEAKLFNDIVYPALRQGYLETHESELGPDEPGVAMGDGGTHQMTLPVPPPPAPR